MNNASLALRNLLRNRRRSLTTLLAMISGLTALLLFGGFSKDIELAIQSNYVRQGGHLQIQHQDYFLYGSGNPAAYGIADYPQLIKALENDPVLAPMLTVVTPTLSLGGIAGNYSAGVSRTVFGVGVDVAGQNKLQQWDDYNFPDESTVSALTGTGSNSVIIGSGLARMLQLCAPLKLKDCPPQQVKEATGSATPDDIALLAGDEAASTAKAALAGQIELLAASSHGAPNVATLDVVGAETTGIKEYDDMALTLHLAQAQQLLYGKDTPRVTAIALQLKHTSQIEAARARIKELLAGPLKGSTPLTVLDYETIYPQYGQTTRMFSSIFSFIVLIIGAIALFMVSNTMSMAVLERTVEIGTLRAMGLTRGGIRRLFMSEGVLLGVLGAGLGIAIALGLAWLINHGGVTWQPPAYTDPVPLTVGVWGQNRMLIGSAVGLVLVAALSAWWPARRAARLDIVDALRHV